MSETIEIYPSNWLYNASVIGFIKSIFDIEKDDVEKWFKDNILSLPRDILNRLQINDRYFNDDKSKNISSIVGKSPLYRNYINPSRKQDKSGFGDFVKKLSQVQEQGQSFCGICSRNFALSSEDIEDLNNKWSEHNPKLNVNQGGQQSKKPQPINNGFENFFSNLQRYNVAHNNLIAPSIREFPNAFWNLNNSISICPLCAYLIIHHHIPFENAITQEGEIFINAPSFKIMWYLNRFAEKVLTKSKEHELRKILALSLMEFAQKVSVTLGAWSIMNVEMIIKKSKRIDYYCLPYQISKVLLQKDIATLISETKEPKVLETVLNGKFDYLLTLNHKILRSLTSGSDATKDNSLSELINKDASNLRSLSRILPKLYAKIDYTIKKG